MPRYSYAYQGRLWQEAFGLLAPIRLPSNPVICLPIVIGSGMAGSF